MFHSSKFFKIAGSLFLVFASLEGCSIPADDSAEFLPSSSSGIDKSSSFQLASSDGLSSGIFSSSTPFSHSGVSSSSGLVQSSESSSECFEENQLMPFVSATDPVTMPRQNKNKCCGGLKEVITHDFIEENLDPSRLPCGLKAGSSPDFYYCVKCGDGICSEFEHPCTCPEDCE